MSESLGRSSKIEFLHFVGLQWALQKCNSVRNLWLADFFSFLIHSGWFLLTNQDFLFACFRSIFTKVRFWCWLIWASFFWTQHIISIYSFLSFILRKFSILSLNIYCILCYFVLKGCSEEVLDVLCLFSISTTIWTKTLPLLPPHNLYCVQLKLS